jgi:7-cyano-7-deazaguanine reductase
MNDSTAHDSPLGKTVAGSHQYAPELLFPIPRAPKRVELGISDTLPFFAGVDIWNGYELSWLNARGKPVVATAEFRIPATSPNLIESKSFKLYLNSLNQTRFADSAAVRETLMRDLSQASGAGVDVELSTLLDDRVAPIKMLAGELIDELDIAIDHYGPPAANLLGCEAGTGIVEETLVSHLLKSNCPVTGQPDWASVQIHYRGARIDREGLLRYLVSFRMHDDFHEQCVERIFVDLANHCSPAALSVYARYTRRGGLDINPWRSNVTGAVVANERLARQ